MGTVGSTVGCMHALTQLSPDEILFRKTVRDFASKEITPLVRSMDEDQAFDAELLRKLFQLGLMGIQIPEATRGNAF
jgi:alkylation response protein AidB-like acyl-CoA dehydrogenase